MGREMGTGNIVTSDMAEWDESYYKSDLWQLRKIEKFEEQPKKERELVPDNHGL